MWSKGRSRVHASIPIHLDALVNQQQCALTIQTGLRQVGPGTPASSDYLFSRQLP
jgi:hypothetical protein